MFQYAANTKLSERPAKAFLPLVRPHARCPGSRRPLLPGAEKREEALLLLQTPLAQDYLRQVEAALGGEGLTATAEEGYRRLAFGPVTDAVRLMFPTEDETPPLEEMDLYNISKISQAKGGLEITFFDRLEALDRLAAQQKETAVQQDAFGFLDAVAAGAAAGDEEDR